MSKKTIRATAIAMAEILEHQWPDFNREISELSMGELRVLLELEMKKDEGDRRESYLKRVKQRMANEADKQHREEVSKLFKH